MSQDRGVLESNMIMESEQIKCVPSKYFISKGIEIYEMLLVRHGLMVVGEALSGKSSCLKTLQKGLEAMGQTVQQRIINPKGVTDAQLYGNLNPDTKVWTEGVIP